MIDVSEQWWSVNHGYEEPRKFLKEMEVENLELPQLMFLVNKWRIQKRQENDVANAT